MSGLLLIPILVCVLANASCLGVLTSTIYRAVENYALQGHDFTEVTGVSAVKCVALCLVSHHGRCRSVNYDRINAACQMNDATKEEFIEEFHHSPSFCHYRSDIPELVIGGSACPKVQKVHTETQSSEPKTVANRDAVPTPPTVCEAPLGMASGQIPDDKISVSSLDAGYYISNTRFNDDRAWCAQPTDTNPWVQVDFDEKVFLTDVETEGQSVDGIYIDNFKVQHGDDGVEWTTVQNVEGTGDAVFDGPPFAAYLSRTVTLPTAVYARFIRLQPTTSQFQNVCMKFELFGCR